jgi:hypothetical protein
VTHASQMLLMSTVVSIGHFSTQLPFKNFAAFGAVGQLVQTEGEEHSAQLSLQISQVWLLVFATCFAGHVRTHVSL